MYHVIEFVTDWWADVEPAPGQLLERLRVRRGTRRRARVLPRVAESADGPVETADLVFEDGSVARGMSRAAFRVVE